MARTPYSPANIRMLQLTALGMLVFVVGFGLLCQVEGLKLPGAALILVGVLSSTLFNLFKAQISDLSARVEELENKLAAATPA